MGSSVERVPPRLLPTVAKALGRSSSSKINFNGSIWISVMLYAFNFAYNIQKRIFYRNQLSLETKAPLSRPKICDVPNYSFFYEYPRIFPFNIQFSFQDVLICIILQFVTLWRRRTAIMKQEQAQVWLYSDRFEMGILAQPIPVHSSSSEKNKCQCVGLLLRRVTALRKDSATNGKETIRLPVWCHFRWWFRHRQ